MSEKGELYEHLVGEHGWAYPPLVNKVTVAYLRHMHVGVAHNPELHPHLFRRRLVMSAYFWAPNHEHCLDHQGQKEPE